MKLFATLLVPLALNLHRNSFPRINQCLTTTMRSSSSSSSSTTRPSHSLEDGSTAPSNCRVIHCNHAGASPSPSSVLDTVWKHLQLEQSMGGYMAAEMASGQLQTVYERVGQLLQLHCHTNSAKIGSSDTTTTISSQDPTHDIALVESATVAWTRLFYSMAQYQHEKRRQQSQQQQPTPHAPLVILVSEAEYAANVVAACQWAKDHHNQQQHPKWTVLALPSTRTDDGGSTGKVNLQILQEMLQGTYQYQYNETTVTLDPSNIAMICVTHIPTNAGIVNDVEGIGELIANYNNKDKHDMPSILYLVDACQSIGQRQVNVHQVRCHGLVATGRKFLRGPRGTGFLYVPHQVANQLRPHHMDHHGNPIMAVPASSTYSSSKVAPLPVEDLIKICPKPGASRFEFYESNIANKLGLGEAIRYAIEDVGMDTIQSTTTTLAQDLHQRLQTIKTNTEKVHVHHAPESGIVTFYVPSVPSKKIKQRLWDTDDAGGIQFETSLVPATSTPLDSSQTGVTDMVRVSLTYTNTVKDLDVLCDKLESILQDI